MPHPGMGPLVQRPFRRTTAYYCISNIDDFEARLELESQYDNKNELANLDFSTPTLNVKPKKLTLGIKLLHKLSTGTKLLQNLPNGKKKL